jgi:hypothetical protein
MDQIVADDRMALLYTFVQIETSKNDGNARVDIVNAGNVV